MSRTSIDRFRRKAGRAGATPLGCSFGCSYAFFGFFAMIGGIAFVFIVWNMLIPAIRSSTVYVETTGVVLDKRLVESHGDDGTTYRPEILIRYKANGQTFETWTYDAAKIASSGRKGKQAILDRFQVGARYPCWYDPDDPGKAVVKRGIGFLVPLFTLFPLIFVGIGVGGIVYHRRQRHREAERTRALEWGEAPPLPEGRRYANVPEIDLSDRPGETLRYSLAGDRSSWVGVLFLFGFAVFWNGITSIFVYQAVQSHLAGRPEWGLTIFITPFVLIGLGVAFALVYTAVRTLLIAVGVGPTEVEISDHPLRSGGTYEVLVRQKGRLTMSSLRLTLVCEESATYRQGTDTRTETKNVVSREIVREEDFEIHKEFPFESRREMTLPDGAMHSFEADHNKITWKLVVNGEIVGWPDIERAFPVSVVPEPLEGGAP